jgi:competence protein ComEA
MPERLRGLWQRIRAGEDPAAFGAVVVVVALTAGLVWFWAGDRSGGLPAASAAPGSPSVGGPAPAPTAHTAFLTSTTAAALAVHVAGAVARPGLYRLPPGSRVADALALAGGKLPRADLDRLNLAARLVDGQKVHVTGRGEPVPPGSGAETATGALAGGESGTAAASEPIDLNAADLAALDSLPGVGPATARAILEERAKRGGFRSTRDLLRVPGIGEGRFARLKDRVRV